MSFDGQTVSVVYSISGTASAEYPVQVTGNILTFTMPGLASASVGAGSMQVRIYGSESLLQSAIIPYAVKASLDPGPAEDDQVPMLVMLVQQAQQAIAGLSSARPRWTALTRLRTPWRSPRSRRTSLPRWPPRTG